MIDLDELKRLAQAATTGPWKWWTSNSELRLTGADQKDGGVLHAYKHSTWADISCSVANQDFIAAANPAVILKLIDEVRLHHFSWAGCAQQLKDAIVDLEEVESKCKTQAAENAELKRDAERYRWLREQHWNEADMAVVFYPKKSVKLGFDCPSLDRLDAAIDAARATSSPETSAPSRPGECQSPGETVRSAK
jgi:hypothetical protein